MTGSVDMRGWALDLASTDGPGIDRVEVLVDGRSLGPANYGVARPDVADTFGAGFNGVGWTASVDLRGVVPFGQHTLEARAHSRSTGLESSFQRTIDFEAATAPHGTVDEPQDGATVRGVVEARGWALDEAVQDGTGVDRVEVLIDGVAQDGVEYGYARPEIAAAYGERFTNSGWRISLDVTSVSSGQHTLEVRAHSTASGQDTAYTRTFTVAR